jgi:hypothetical protein
MDDIIHGIKKWLHYFSIGCFALFMFGITGWGILMIVGYGYLNHLHSARSQQIPNAPIQTPQNPTIIAQHSNPTTSEVGKLRTNQVIRPRISNRRRVHHH